MDMQTLTVDQPQDILDYYTTTPWAECHRIVISLHTLPLGMMFKVTHNWR